MSKEQELADKKIVVTGATGLVGSHLVAELMRSGYRKITLPMRNRKRMAQLHKTLSREGIDVSSAEFSVGETTLNNPRYLADMFKNADIVFNCAAMVAIGGVNPEDLIRTNVEITQHVVDAALKCNVRKLVHVSSISALGTPLEGEKYVDEETAMETLAGANPYGKSKFLSENEVMRGAYLGLESVIVNPATILGSGDWEGGSSVIIPVLARGLKVYTEGVTAWVDVKDVAKAMVLLANCDKAVNQKFILAADNISYKELITMSNAVIGRKPPTINIGSRLVGAASKLEKMIAKISKHDQLITDEIAEILLSEKYYCGDKIKKTIDFEYTPLEETIERVIKDYLADRNG